MITIERLESGAVRVLRAKGDIDEDGMNTVRLALADCIDDRRCNVVLNLEEVKYVSYMGLGVLVERLRQLQACRGNLKLVGVNLYLERLLRMAGLSRVFELFEREGQAIQSYRAAA